MAETILSENQRKVLEAVNHEFLLGLFCGNYGLTR